MMVLAKTDPDRRARYQEGHRYHGRFHGTSRQVKGSINLPIAMTQSSVYACLRSVVGPNVPTNSGFMRPIRVIAEPGSIVNPISPPRWRRAG
jgi:N-methylhydantoinase B/oxoprolinase/acetone carboxylase alpha subunit